MSYKISLNSMSVKTEVNGEEEYTDLDTFLQLSTSSGLGVLDNLASLLTESNNDKVVIIRNSALVAENLNALLPNGDEVSY